VTAYVCREHVTKPIAVSHGDATPQTRRPRADQLAAFHDNQTETR
jgi:hypothetical protein